MSSAELPDCVWSDTLALLERAFRRCGFSENEVVGLLAHAAVIGDDAEGWGLLDNECRATVGQVSSAELADGVVGAIASDLYGVGDGAPMRETIFAATNAWLKLVVGALREETGATK